MKKRLGEQVTATLEPVNILDRIIAETKLTPQDEAYDIAKRGVSAFIEELLKSKSSAEPVKKALVDKMIAAIDEKLSRRRFSLYVLVDEL